jgi:FtsZ-binding cell division protein ZapB
VKDAKIDFVDRDLKEKTKYADDLAAKMRESGVQKESEKRKLIEEINNLKNESNSLKENYNSLESQSSDLTKENESLKKDLRGKENSSKDRELEIEK